MSKKKKVFKAKSKASNQKTKKSSKNSNVKAAKTKKTLGKSKISKKTISSKKIKVATKAHNKTKSEKVSVKRLSKKQDIKKSNNTKSKGKVKSSKSIKVSVKGKTKNISSKKISLEPNKQEAISRTLPVHKNADLKNQKTKVSSSVKTTKQKSNSSVSKDATSPKKNLVVNEEGLGNLPPGKFELEYVVHSSAELLFNFLTEPSGLSEWFCDDVNIRHGVYTFFWDGTQQQAKELKLIPERLVRFQWMEKTDGSYFEFRIEKDDLTGDISLIITDFAENAEERNSSKLLWDSQIDKLLHVLGAYF